ncbi:hypothetical protein ROA7450_01275 [Roseovarius albus]|uniref:DUF2793 domain-containing protein n=1 Tax=Roseovarius albus TaxID=1247867 RepID=A0A1X6YS92_9RHOB|nr:DUF2793 domain-containing protein [Roseovarius albus]SLN29655.1 hypothetical protein ROA7450_01275 [Roseovarius albus]
MSESSPVLSLPYIQPSQAQKHVTHNEALRILDAVTQLCISGYENSAPPAAPAHGERHIVATSGNGDWAGHDGEIAVFSTGGWVFFSPQNGWRADIIATGEQLRFDSAGWTLVEPNTQNLSGVGIATASDSANRLAVSSEATLLTHDGNGHQLKINKANTSDTSSLLFQTGWSGRAEMGTTGSDNFAIKASADGSTFHTALSVEANGGALHTPQGQIYFDDTFITSDSVHSIDIPWSDPARMLLWLGVDLPGHSYLFAVTGALSGVANFTAMFVNPAGTLNFQTGALTGTTGPAAAINLAIDISGSVPQLHIENRLGSDQTFTLATLGK